MWQEIEGKLVLEKKFSDFKQAFSFVSQVAMLAEKEQHHPDIEISYDTVRLSLVTHDQGSVITKKDRQLAEMIDTL